MLLIVPQENTQAVDDWTRDRRADLVLVWVLPRVVALACVVRRALVLVPLRRLSVDGLRATPWRRVRRVARRPVVLRFARRPAVERDLDLALMVDKELERTLEPILDPAPVDEARDLAAPIEEALERRRSCDGRRATPEC